MPRKMGYTLPGVPYTDPWPERWYNLTGKWPDVEAIVGPRTGQTKPGAQYRFRKPKRAEP